VPLGPFLNGSIKPSFIENVSRTIPKSLKNIVGQNLFIRKKIFLYIKRRRRNMLSFWQMKKSLKIILKRTVLGKKPALSNWIQLCLTRRKRMGKEKTALKQLRIFWMPLKRKMLVLEVILPTTVKMQPPHKNQHVDLAHVEMQGTKNKLKKRRKMKAFNLQEVLKSILVV